MPLCVSMSRGRVPSSLTMLVCQNSLGTERQAVRKFLLKSHVKLFFPIPLVLLLPILPPDIMIYVFLKVPLGSDGKW